MAAKLKIAPHPLAKDVLLHLAPLPSYVNSTSGVEVWIFFEGANPVTAWSSGWPVHPAQIYSTASDTGILTIAQDTVLTYQSGGGRVQFEYAAIVRAGLQGTVRGRHRGSPRALTAVQVLDRMEKEMAPLLMPNLVLREQLTAPGGWLENTGITLAINEMLVAGNPTGEEETPWLIELFPGWPSTESAAFTSLRVKGGFELSASYSNSSGVSTPITMSSHAGEPCAILDPWWNRGKANTNGIGDRNRGDSIMVSTVSGVHVPVRWVAVRSGDAFVFNTTGGVEYVITSLATTEK